MRRFALQCRDSVAGQTVGNDAITFAILPDIHGVMGLILRGRRRSLGEG
jgi:hypothetical protein